MRSFVPATSGPGGDGRDEQLPSAGELDPVVDAVGTWTASGGPVLVVSVDGHGAAGKTTYATALAKRLGASLVHTDDFFQPSCSRATHVSPADPLASYYDWRRLRAEALVPLRAGGPAAFRRYDWQLDELRGPRGLVVPRPVVILEGVFSSAPQLADLLDRSVFMDTPEHERLRRLRARVAPEDWDDDWLRAEQAYFSVIRPPPSFDLVVSGMGAATDVLLPMQGADG